MSLHDQLTLVEASADELIEPFGVISATLCLMSAALQRRYPPYLPRIVANLEWLADQHALARDFRLGCSRLADHWQQVLDAEARNCASPPSMTGPTEPASAAPPTKPQLH